MSHVFYQCIYYVSGPWNISVVSLSMEGQIVLKCLCSEDEQRSYEFGTRVINDRIFISGGTLILWLSMLFV